MACIPSLEGGDTGVVFVLALDNRFALAIRSSLYLRVIRTPLASKTSTLFFIAIPSYHSRKILQTRKLDGSGFFKT
jgi:hypothetical protein